MWVVLFSIFYNYFMQFDNSEVLKNLSVLHQNVDIVKKLVSSMQNRFIQVLEIYRACTSTVSSSFRSKNVDRCYFPTRTVKEVEFILNIYF